MKNACWVEEVMERWRRREEELAGPWQLRRESGGTKRRRLGHRNFLSLFYRCSIVV